MNVITESHMHAFSFESEYISKFNLKPKISEFKCLQKQ